MISDPHLPCKTDFLQNEYLVNPKFSIVKNYCCFLMFCFFVCTTPLLAQTEKAYNAQDSLLPNWVKLMYTQNPDPGAVTRAYDEYYGSTPLVKNSHTQYYKRWIRSIGRAVSKNYIPQNKIKPISGSAAANANWQSIGPWTFDKGAESVSYAAGAAHVYTIEQAISNTDVLFAGTATAGVWKTLDKGLNWMSVTDTLMIGSVVALEINHQNDNTVYFGGGTNIYKTYNGGISWEIVGDATFQVLDIWCNDLVMDPTDTNRLFAATDIGLFVTTDGGANFSQVVNDEIQEVEFHPTDPTIIYVVRQTASQTEFHKSVDGGISFVQKTNGWPSPVNPDEQKRTEIAVTLAAPGNVYALATGSANGGSGLYGIYVSQDEGESWTFRCCGAQPAGPPDSTNLNLMGWQDNGSDDGGQYYYDLAFDVSPIDADRLHVGGVNHWISSDGGYTFTCPSKWSHSYKDNYVHADIHDIRFYGDDLWIACDGGIFYSDDTGATVQVRMFGIAGTDFWGFGAGHSDPNVMLGGTYHNGTLLKDNQVYNDDWISTDGGDNIRGYVNYGNSRLCYSDYGGKVLSGDRTVANTSFTFDSLPNASYISGASSNLEFDPTQYNTMYVGRNNLLLRTVDNGGSFELIHNFGKMVTSIELAWSDPEVLYVCTYEDWWGAKQVWRTEDGGQIWTEITPFSSLLNGDDWVPYDITISNTDANSIWLARTSQYGNSPNMDGYQVFQSSDGGTTWNNYSSPSLDGEWPTNIEFQRGTDGGVYLGTRSGVYYRNNTLSEWELYSSGLPANCNSTQLVINYKDQKLVNGTNRGAWESDLYEASAPQAQISSDTRLVNCFINAVQFVSYSAVSDSNASFQWNFPGGSPSISTLENPVVTYGTPGNYSVTLTVTDAYGTNTQTIVDFIEFQQEIKALPHAEDFESAAFTPAYWNLINWDNGATWQSISLQEGADCNPTTAAHMNHFYFDNPGEEDDLISPYIDLFGANNPILTYDYAYARWGNGYEDGFRVEVSSDCGATWTILYDKFGDQLETIGPQQNVWEPTCADWVQVAIDLTPYSAGPVMLNFVGVNGWGNNFYLDNIQIEDTASCPLPVSAFAYADSSATLYFSDLSAGASGWYWDFGDGIISIDQNPIHSYFSEGTYDVCLITSNGCGIDTLCQSVTIIIPISIPEPNATAGLLVIPNPFDHTATVYFDNTDNDAFQLTIYDLLGNKVRQKISITSDRIVIRKDNLSPGIYCIVLTNGQHTYRERIVVE